MPDPYIHGAHTLVKHLPPDTRTGVIAGVLRGVDAQILLDNLPNLERLWLVDDWSLRGLPEGFKDSARTVRQQAHERLAPYLDRVRWLECESKYAPYGVHEDADFIYLDGDHSERGCRRDIREWWVRVIAGGILAGHDYGHPGFPGVKKAVDAAGFGDLKVDGTVWLTTA